MLIVRECGAGENASKPLWHSVSGSTLTLATPLSALAGSAASSTGAGCARLPTLRLLADVVPKPLVARL
jgi:hypothetical protein